MTHKVFQEGDIVEGTVTGVQSYGAFVELDDHVKGLVHISEVTNGFVKDIHQYVQKGDHIKVKILHIDKDQSRFALSMRALVQEENRDTSEHEVNQGFHTLKNKLNEWIKQSQ
ncbi:general stress protein 13 [Gracilibacillus halophilus YIM-C55.5]|uniref:General stress protein 13 n=1 Tax=Gracilibacillus halophilus YIM-C55.5 TaxID=1308866 RepID=N4WRV1_9BACI|nr:CvfD/Ygs/GSP13 family RNA-binding post-transcriptional regulator [Gracilibacillus halophilus]ENH97110.1 general stress protein 13 [Gracilibacillus halophilus YIM-C55.5]